MSYHDDGAHLTVYGGGSVRPCPQCGKSAYMMNSAKNCGACEQHAHPVALKPGKVLVEAEWRGERSFDRPVVFSGEWTICADPATVHPASEMEDGQYAIEMNNQAHAVLQEPNILETLPSAAKRVVAERDNLRAKLAAAEDEAAETKKSHCKDCCCARSWEALDVQSYTGMSIPEHIELIIQERDTARRELAEALEWMREEIYPYQAINYGHTGKGNAILARHAPERRKEERRKVQMICSGKERSGSDRRKASVAVDWQAKAHEKHEKWLAADERAEAAEVECERLRKALGFSANGTEAAENEAKKYWEMLCDSAEALGLLVPETAPYLPGHCKAIAQKHTEQLAAALARAEAIEAELARLSEKFHREEEMGDETRRKLGEAVAKLEKVQQACTLRSQGFMGMGAFEEKVNAAILDTPPPQQQAEPTEWISAVKQFEAIEQLQREIDAIKDAQKARA